VLVTVQSNTRPSRGYLLMKSVQLGVHASYDAGHYPEAAAGTGVGHSYICRVSSKWYLQACFRLSVAVQAA
jgi:hypothetical protein